MSTNSRLRMVLPSGETLKPIYVHWDGDPGNMLPLLRGNYNHEDKVRELLALGDLSYLAERVKPNEGEYHSFERPAKGVTVAYHRDRGESLSFTGTKQQYNYVFHEIPNNGLGWELE